MNVQFSFTPLQNLYAAVHRHLLKPDRTMRLEAAARHVEEAYQAAENHQAYIKQARARYVNDDLEIDDHPMVSPIDEGCWVNAWVWVSKEEAQ